MCILLHIIRGFLRHDQRVGHGRLHLFVVAELRADDVHFFFHRTVLAVNLFIVARKLFQKGIHFILRIAADLTGKCFIMNIHRCDHDLCSFNDILTYEFKGSGFKVQG